MEMAHAILVTKSDIDQGATNRATAILRSSMQFMMPSAEGWTVPILPISVLSHSGVDETLDIVGKFFAHERDAVRASLRRDQRMQWFDTALHQELLGVLMSQASATAVLSSMREHAVAGNVPPTLAVHRLLTHLTFSIKEQP
jgi:putative protein kinase ArgK-like GTPase of G3E family